MWSHNPALSKTAHWWSEVTSSEQIFRAAASFIYREVPRPPSSISVTLCQATVTSLQWLISTQISVPLANFTCIWERKYITNITPRSFDTTLQKLQNALVAAPRMTWFNLINPARKSAVNDKYNHYLAKMSMKWILNYFLLLFQMLDKTNYMRDNITH